MVSARSAVGAERDDGRIEQDRGGDGLDEDVLEADVLGLLQHLLAAVGRHHHEMGRELEIGQREDALAGLDAVEPGHLPVDEGDLVALVELGRPGAPWRGLLAGGRLVGDEGHVGQHVRRARRAHADCRR